MLPIDPALLALAAEQGLLPGTRPQTAPDDTTKCAKCGVEITADRFGWWVDGDGDSFCPDDDGEHRSAEL
jgi:hypothetical protein